MMNLKNVVFLVVLVVCLPFAIVGAAAALVMAGLRGGFMTMESFLRWVTE